MTCSSLLEATPYELIYIYVAALIPPTLVYTVYMALYGVEKPLTNRTECRVQGRDTPVTLRIIEELSLRYWS